MVTMDDGRRFLVDPREPQYLMGLLPMDVREELESRVLALCLKLGAVIDIGAKLRMVCDTVLARSQRGRRGARIRAGSDEASGT